MSKGSLEARHQGSHGRRVLGYAIAFRILPGQAKELPQAAALPDRAYHLSQRRSSKTAAAPAMPIVPMSGAGGRPAIPPQHREAPLACPDGIQRAGLEASARTSSASVCIGFMDECYPNNEFYQCHCHV